MELLCFDLDNTLLKATKAHLKAFKESFKIHHLPKKTDKQIITVLNLASIDMIPRLYPKLSKKQIKEIIKTHDKIFQTKTSKPITSITGAINSLKKLKPNYKIAILSNSNYKNVITALKRAKIKTSYFDLILSADEVKKHKPHPEGIFKAKRILHCKEGFMIGDSIYDIQAGKAAKFKTIAVTTGNDSKKQLLKETPFLLIKSVKFLPKIL